MKTYTLFAVIAFAASACKSVDKKSEVRALVPSDLQGRCYSDRDTAEWIRNAVPKLSIPEKKIMFSATMAKDDGCGSGRYHLVPSIIYSDSFNGSEEIIALPVMDVGDREECNKLAMEISQLSLNEACLASTCELGSGKVKTHLMFVCMRK